MRLGLFASSFDPWPHCGHVWAMQQAVTSGACEGIVAALQGDPTHGRPSKRKPVLSNNERSMLLLALRYVVSVAHYRTEEQLRQLIESVKPSVLILGEDHRGERHTGDDLVNCVFYAKRRPDWSGTEFDRRIGERWVCRQGS